METEKYFSAIKRVTYDLYPSIMIDDVMEEMNRFHETNKDLPYEMYVSEFQSKFGTILNLIQNGNLYREMRLARKSLRTIELIFIVNLVVAILAGFLYVAITFGTVK